MNICKKFRVEMAHRVRDAYTYDCRGLHGHSYVIELTLGDKPSGSFGSSGKDMVIDFTEIKDIVKTFIDNIDHSLMVWKEDKTLVDLAPVLNKKNLIVPFNPTAENMAKWIFENIHADLLQAGKQCRLVSVIVRETESAYAQYFDYDYNADKIGGTLFENLEEIDSKIEAETSIAIKDKFENREFVLKTIKEAVEKNTLNLNTRSCDGTYR